MHVDNILAGLKQDEVNKFNDKSKNSVADSKQQQLMKDKETKYKGKDLQSIKEEKFEVGSQGSMPS